MAKNLFGDEIEENELLRDVFMEPPFSVLDAKGGEWQKRKQKWLRLGIRSEVGRDVAVVHQTFQNMRPVQMPKESIFDPALTELMYRWFCPDNGRILDPFAGGSVRGIVAQYLGYKYCGIELRREQCEANREQAEIILADKKKPLWLEGDSEEILDQPAFGEPFDFIFSCPPPITTWKFTQTTRGTCLI